MNIPLVSGLFCLFTWLDHSTFIRINHRLNQTNCWLYWGEELHLRCRQLYPPKICDSRTLKAAPIWSIGRTSLDPLYLQWPGRDCFLFHLKDKNTSENRILISISKAFTSCFLSGILIPSIIFLLITHLMSCWYDFTVLLLRT